MYFLSFTFWTICIISIILFSYLRDHNTKSLILLLVSLVIYIIDSKTSIPLFLVITLTTYISTHFGKRVIISAIFFNICILFGYKAFSSFNINKSILPIGLSFYTLQAIGYLFDIMERKTKTSSIKSLTLFLSFFPQIACGPIEKSTDLIPQLEKLFRPKVKDQILGIRQTVYGFFLKFLLASHLSSFLIDFNEIKFISELLIKNLYFSLYIYFDFAGYSWMALGIANMFGIKLSINFDTPYHSKTISEFWRRWHITLGNWIKHYIYHKILDKNIKGLHKLHIVMSIFIISGVWHGFGFGFILWGVLHGSLYIFEYIFIKPRSKSVIPYWRCVVLLFIYLSWIPFHINSFEDLTQLLFLEFWNLDTNMMFDLNFEFLWIIVSIAITILEPIWYNKVITFSRPSIWEHAFYNLVFLAILLTALINSNLGDGFLYFQF